MHTSRTTVIMSASFSSHSSSLVARKIARESRDRPWLSHAPKRQLSRCLTDSTVSRHRNTTMTASSLSLTSTSGTGRQCHQSQVDRPTGLSGRLVAREPVPGLRQMILSTSTSKTSASSLNLRASARASRNRPWLQSTSAKSSAKVAVLPNTRTAQWVKSQAIGIREAFNAIARAPRSRQSTTTPTVTEVVKPKTTIKAWVQSQVIELHPLRHSPTSKVPLRVSGTGRQCSPLVISPSSYPPLPSVRHPEPAGPVSIISPPKVRRQTAWGTKSTANYSRLLRREFAGLHRPPVLPPFSLRPQHAVEPDKTIAAIVSAAERFNLKTFRDDIDRIENKLNATRRAYLLQRTEELLADSPEPQRPQKLKSSFKSNRPCPRKTVTFNDNPKVTEVPRWIGVYRPIVEDIEPDYYGRYMGWLRAWIPHPNDPYKHDTTWVSSTNKWEHSFSHSDCPNPTCHLRSGDLWANDYMAHTMAQFDDWSRNTSFLIAPHDPTNPE